MLVVWLPLTGDLHNQGLGGPLNFTTSGTITDVDGKIGKAKHFSSAMARAPYNFTLGDEFSFSAWIYWDSFRSDNEWIIELGKTASGYANALFGFNTTKGNGKNTAVAIGGNYVSTLIGNFETKQWFHVAVTWNGSIVKLYSNGVLINSASLSKGSFINSTNISLACNVTNSGTKFTGSLNDVRIYNHCLSDKEVEEIAKGLILYYPLNDTTCEQTTNLIAKLVAGNCTTVTNNVIKNTGQNADTYWYLKPKEALIGGATYTLSCYLKGFSSPTKYIAFGVGSQSGANSAGIWKLYNGYNSFTFIMPSNRDGSVDNFIFDDNGGTRTEIFEIFNVQLEKKDHATVFVEYGQSRTPTTIYDTSGYSNNGTIVGDLSAAAPSPRYKIATQFPGDSFIKKSDFHIGNIWTLSCWFYSPSSSTKAWSPLIICNNTGGDSDSKFSIYYKQTTGVIQFLANGTYDITQTITKDAWHYIVATFDGSMLIGYIDGNQVMTKAISNAELHKTNLGIGARCMGAAFNNYSAPFEGKISDVRIYATALTAAQVTELYNQSMIVDASGNILPRELVN